MKWFLSGVLAVLVMIPIIVVPYTGSSLMPVATTDPPMMFEHSLASRSLHARIKREAPTRDVATFTTGDLMSGANVYVKHCAFCHGLPEEVSIAGKRMFPDAPQLFEPNSMVTDDPVGETYWKVQNGIRLTGMPGFKTALSDLQMWQVSALVTRANQLPVEVKEALKPPAIAPAVSAPPLPAVAAPTPGSAVAPPPPVVPR